MKSEEFKFVLQFKVVNRLSAISSNLNSSLLTFHSSLNEPVFYHFPVYNLP